MTAETKSFEGWCILELLGHRRLAGYVTEVELAGHGFLRLDIPAVDDGGGRALAPATQFYAPGAVYALTPTTEDAARLVRSRPEPVQLWELPRPALAAVSAAVANEAALDALEEDLDEETTPATGFRSELCPVIDRHYKTVELAGLLGVHPETLRRAAQRGELRPVRIGRDLLWPESEVKAWLDANREESRVVPLRRDTHRGRRSA